MASTASHLAIVLVDAHHMVHATFSAGLGKCPVAEGKAGCSSVEASEGGGLEVGSSFPLGFHVGWL